jgi:N-acetylglucosamine malate deacetylase 1
MVYQTIQRSLLMKTDILAVGAHPDDIELGCAGTLLEHIARGHRVGLLDLTRGELGTRGDAATRTEEALDAARAMGAAFRHQLDLGDGFFMEEPESLKAVIAEIRSCRPTIILANAIRDRHPDHGRAASLVARAAFLSGLPRILTYDPEGRAQEAWRPRSVYHYIQDHWVEPDLVVDISSRFERKIELVLRFRTQFYQAGDTGPATPISGQDFLAFLEARARDMGRPAGYRYAEGFTTSRYPGVPDLLTLD